MENNNIENLPEESMTKSHKNYYLIVGIIVLILAILGATYAYYAFAATSDNIIKGSAGVVDLELTVTKVLPDTEGTDDILITNFSELADSLNEGCIDSAGEFALCQLYKVNLANNSVGLNLTLTGKVSFNNSTAPNLSWLYIDGYSADTTYTTATLGDTVNTATSTFVNFIENTLINGGENKDFYLLVWVNEIPDEQTDEGSYSGTVRFEDANGNGVTSTFTS